MNMKEANLKAEIQENEKGVIVIFKVINPARHQQKKFIEVIITPDTLIAKLNNENCFTLQEFRYTKLHIEIAN